ncbi:hypothetical protein OG216_47900 (plasmid) [Streptomycetaceae bacterium NBC_01309]
MTPIYRYRLAPEGLLTRRQLRARGLRPAGQPIAGEIQWRRGRRVAYLYRLDLAAPVREMTPGRARALAAAMRARRTCPLCLRDREFVISRALGCCWPCHQAQQGEKEAA